MAEISKANQERGKAEVKALRERLRAIAKGESAPTVDDEPADDTEPIDKWNQRKDLQ